MSSMNPLKKYPWFSLWYLILMIAVVLSLTVFPYIKIASKAMIMASLIGLYISEAKIQNHIFLTGLIFALLGDAFLLFEGDDFFMIGLVCFLIMQLCYAFTFWKKSRIPRNSDKLKSLVITFIPVLLLAYFWPSLGNLKWPILVYTISIVLMVITAYLRHPLFSGYIYVILGSIFFLVSDALLASKMFMVEIQDYNISVMATYMIAQYLIVTGICLDDYKKIKR